MHRTAVLTETVPDYATRRARIEAEPLPENIGALIDQAAREVGDKIVWNFFEGGGTLTYDQMRRQVNGLAAKLLALGIVKGTRVAVMLPNIPALPLTWLALGRIGAVMVPTNIAYSPRELDHVLKVSGATWLVAHGDVLDMLATAIDAGEIPVEKARVIPVEAAAAQGFGPAWEGLADTPLDQFTAPEPVGHDDLLNIQFTSGTSGFPKGCLLTQRYWIGSGKVNAFRDGRYFERILASTPFFYMDPQWLLLMTLYHRATLFVAARQSLTRFLSWVRDYKIQFCLLPWVIHSRPELAEDNVNELIRCNIYGAPKDLHAKIEARFDVNAREAFGMTEIGPTMFVPLERADKVGSGSCGLPCPFRECRIVNEAGDEVAQGEIGELQVRGPGIMTGYSNNTKASAEAFAPGGWFKTGDLFRQDDEGFFYIVGRKKDMIRRSAENIAAREVETVLAAIEGVAEAAVVGVPDPIRGEEVKAYLRLLDGVAPDTATATRLAQEAAKGLASFKVPRFWTFVEDFPRTASQKIAKPQITAGVADLRAGSFDRVENSWVLGNEHVAKA